MSKSVLVIGGGVSGMAAARALSSLGLNVDLVEKEMVLGGRVARLSSLFPDHRPAQETVAAMADAIASDRRVRTHLGVRPVSLAQSGAGFRAELSDSSAVEADAVVLATGLELVPPSLVPEYGHGHKAGVVTAMELEEALKRGELPGRNGPAERVVLVQCVGSRTERKGVPYCSAVCCANAIKDAMAIKEQRPSAEVTVLYIDIRTCGRGQEDLYRRARRMGVRFIRGQPSLVMERSGGLAVCGENTLLRELYELPADLVVLSCGLRQSPQNLELLDEWEIGQSTVGFPLTVDGCSTNRQGVFVAGSLEGPKDVPAAIAHARSCAVAVKDHLDK